MRRRLLYQNYKIGEGTISPSDSIACDICLYDKNKQKLVIVPNEIFNIKVFPDTHYSPVGVVVIPGTHNIYGIGGCAVMSLKEMNTNTPDTGSTSYQTIYWGQNETDISTLTNYTRVCYVGSNGTVNQTVQDVTDSAYLPSDMFTTVQNPYDKDTWFRYNDSKYYIPSPYNDDDTLNNIYYKTSSPSSSKNVMSDFNGIGNTEILCSLATNQSKWKTASSITNSRGSGYSPAACCCWRYHTDGTNQGDWYLPSMGELGYMMVKLNKLNQTISTLILAYGSTVGVQVRDGYYWSSTEYSNLYVRCVYTNNGCVTNPGKVSAQNSRAFLFIRQNPSGHDVPIYPYS